MTFLNFTFQDPSPLISYSAGRWVEGSLTQDPQGKDYSDGSFKVTIDVGSTASLTFVGTSITIFGAKRPNHGNYSVALDNEPDFVDDGNDQNAEFQVPLWNAQNLNNTEHTVVVTNIPTQLGVYLDIDFITIGREIGPPGFTGQISNVTIDDGSPFVVYNGPWLPASEISPLTAFNSTLHSTTQVGSSVSVFFQGSSIELYGLYVNAPFQVQLDNQPPRNLAGPNVDLDAQEEHPQTLLYLADGLDEDTTHVVTLTNSVTNVGRQFYFDFAIVRSSQKFFEDTPSPDPKFTIPISSSPSVVVGSTSPSNLPGTSPSAMVKQSRVSTGAIVGGVIGGVLVGFIIGFILFRRSKYYGRRRMPARASGDVILTELISEPRSSILTPFVLRNVAGPRPVVVPESHLTPALSPSSRGLYHEITLPKIGKIGNSQHRTALISQTHFLEDHGDAGPWVETIQTSTPPSHN